MLPLCVCGHRSGSQTPGGLSAGPIPRQTPALTSEIQQAACLGPGGPAPRMRAGRTRPRPSSRARVAASAGQTLASPPCRFPEPRSPAAPWRGSSIPRPGGPGRPRLPNHEPQPPCGLDPQRRVEEPCRQMPGLGLLSAGPRTKSASTRAAARRSSAAPRQGSPVPPRPSGGPRTRLAEQIGGGLSPAPAPHTFPVAGAPGDSRGREKRRWEGGALSAP